MLNHYLLVIGCDGIRSRVRQLILGEHNPESYPSYTNKYAFRGLIPMDKAEAALGKAKVETRHMYLGPDGHALTFPVAGGKLLNVVAFTTDLNEWPDKDKFTLPARKADAVEAFAHFNPIVRNIIDLLPDELDKWAIFDTYEHPASTFIKGRLSLCGDAAHAAAPYHGAGAGFAIEDGAVLAHLLQNAQRVASTSEQGKASVLRDTLTSYNTIRFERSLWLVETSRFVGQMYEWQNADIGRDCLKVAREIEWRCNEIWDYDIGAMLAKSEEVCGQGSRQKRDLKGTTGFDMDLFACSG